LNTAAAIFASVLFSVTPARGATFSANPALDALVTTGPTGDLVNNNYGGAGSLSLSAAGLEMGELQSVLQFNVAGAVSTFDAQFGVGQWTIESVSLRLTAANANNAIFNSPAAGLFSISWMQNDSWQEGTGSPASPGATGVTFNSLLNTFIGPNDENLGRFTFSGATSGATTYSLGLTPGFLNDIVSGSDVSLRLFAADSGVSGVFSSRNFGTVANRPLLTVVAVPEPGTVGLISLGCLVAAAWRLRLRRNSG
jgi:hypothetical protein